MLRLTIILGFAFGFFALIDGLRGTAQAATGTTTTADLKDLLEKGLKARRPEEFEFIATVIAKVQSGDLPESIVRGTFLWARKHTVNEFQYFQFGLRERAKKLGVTL